MGYQLTKEDVKALKGADDICFDYYESQGSIRGIKRTRGKKMVGGYVLNDDLSHEVKTNSRFQLYKDSERGNKYQTTDSRLPHACFVSQGMYDSIRTFIEFLKAGDEITLDWHGSSGGYVGGSKSTVYADDGSAVCYEARLWSDQLYAIIYRGDKTYTFMISSSTCPENSARMIRMFR